MAGVLTQRLAGWSGAPAYVVAVLAAAAILLVPALNLLPPHDSALHLSDFAVTVGGSRGGVVYVISDRLGGRDLSGVMMHEFGHVLGAGHGQHGLMAPVYSLDGARCIDYAAAGLVAQAQRLPLAGMNWCEGLGRERMPAANAGANHGYTSSSVRGQTRD